MGSFHYSFFFSVHSYDGLCTSKTGYSRNKAREKQAEGECGSACVGDKEENKRETEIERQQERQSQSFAVSNLQRCDSFGNCSGKVIWPLAHVCKNKSRQQISCKGSSEMSDRASSKSLCLLLLFDTCCQHPSFFAPRTSASKVKINFGYRKVHARVRPVWSALASQDINLALFYERKSIASLGLEEESGLGKKKNPGQPERYMLTCVQAGKDDSPHATAMQNVHGLPRLLGPLGILQKRIKKTLRLEQLQYAITQGLSSSLAVEIKNA